MKEKVSVAVKLTFSGSGIFAKQTTIVGTVMITVLIERVQVI